jgi:phosphotransferase system HPr (HPr) family protein
MERSTIVRVHEGLHARPATRFVKLAKSFESDVEIVKDGKAASAKSSVKLMLLGVKEDQEVTVRATGADAIEAVEALIGYLENPLSGLDEDASAPSDAAPVVAESAPATPVEAPEPAAAADGTLRGIAASEGVAIGPAFAHFPPEIRAEGRELSAGEIPAEIETLRNAIAAVQRRMDKALAENSLSAGDRGIIAALKDIAAEFRCDF